MNDLESVLEEVEPRPKPKPEPCPVCHERVIEPMLNPFTGKWYMFGSCEVCEEGFLAAKARERCHASLRHVMSKCGASDLVVAEALTTKLDDVTFVKRYATLFDNLQTPRVAWIQGGPGTGRTTRLIRVIESIARNHIRSNKLHDVPHQGVPRMMYLTEHEALARLGGDEAAEFEAKMLASHLLCIDQMGTGSGAPWAISRLRALLAALYESGVNVLCASRSSCRDLRKSGHEVIDAQYEDRVKSELRAHPDCNVILTKPWRTINAGFKGGAHE